MKRWRNSLTLLNVIYETFAKLFKLEINVNDMSLIVVINRVTSFKDLKRVEEN